MKLMTVVLLGLFAVACGGGGGSSAPLEVTETEKAAAKTTVDSVRQLDTLKSDKGSDQAMSGLGQVYSSSAQLVAKKQQAELGTGNPYALSPDYEQIASALSQDCYTVNGDTVTYNNCNYGGGGSNFTINGTITTSGDTVTIDLTMVGDYSGQAWDYTWSGTVTVTATSIDGNLSFALKMNAQGMDIIYDVSIDFNAIVLDASGCAIGGGMVIDSSTETGGYGGYDTSVEVTFGPACGDVAMF
jgi:hypothetical protein